MLAEIDSERFSQRKNEHDFLMATVRFFTHNDREAGRAKHALLSVALQLSENVPGVSKRCKTRHR